MWLREFISRILDFELNYVLDVHFVFYVMYHLCYLCIPPLRLEMLKRMSTCTIDYHGVGERGGSNFYYWYLSGWEGGLTSII